MQKQARTQNQLLLLRDVDGVGRKGELVSVKPGFARNYLMPQQMAVIADKRTLRMQERLRKERQEQAVVDLKESEEIKAQLEHKEFDTIVKVDHEGHLYGSVSINDIVEIVKEKTGIELERRFVRLAQPIKKLGAHPIRLVLKEGIECEIALTVRPDRAVEGQPESNEITVE